MPYYIFLYEDKRGNVLTERLVESKTLLKAKELAKHALAVTSMNDLYKIRVIKEK